MPNSKPARLIAVGGGKGGVGKSVIAANLAVAMADAGVRAVLVDADLGAANQHTLFGIISPGPGLQGFLDRETDSLEAVLLPTMVKGLRLLPGTGAVAGAANINHAQKQRVLRHLTGLDADVVIIDVGAGVSYNVLDFYDLATFRLVVMTPQLTSIQNAYAFLKGALIRWIRHAAEGDEDRAALDAELGHRETERVPEALARIGERHPRLAEAIGRALARFAVKIVGNQVQDPKEVGVFHSVARMISNFLGIEAPVLASLPASRRLHESVNARRPLCVDAPRDELARWFQWMAEALLLAPDPALRADGAPEQIADRVTMPLPIPPEPALAATASDRRGTPALGTPLTASARS